MSSASVSSLPLTEQPHFRLPGPTVDVGEECHGRREGLFCFLPVPGLMMEVGEMVVQGCFLVAVSRPVGDFDAVFNE